MRSASAISIFAALVSLLAPFCAQAGPDRIVTSQFAAFAGAQGSTLTFYVKGKNGWEPIPRQGAGELRRFGDENNIAECLRDQISASFFHQFQAMAINKFVKTGYITLEQAADLLKNAVNFTDRPITFFSYLTDKPVPDGLSAIASAESQLVLGVDYPLPRVAGIAEPISEKGFLHATVYSMAGQKMVPNSETIYPASIPLELPWMKDPDFSGQMINRDHYQLLWEVGRGAGTEKGQFAQLMGMAGQGILRETQHYGVPSLDMVNRASVSFYSHNPELIAKMTDKFPPDKFPKVLVIRSKTNPKKVVFVIPLKDFLTGYPPDEVVSANNVLKRAFANTRSPEQVQNFIESLKYLQAAALDFRYQGKFTGKPLFFNISLTGYKELMVRQYTKDLGMTPEEYQRVDGDLINHTIDPMWPGVVVDPSTPYSIPEGAAPKGIQISNLDPVLAENDPDYAPAALVAVFNHFIEKTIRPPIPITSPELSAAADKFRNAGIGFVITTHYPQTAGALMKLGGKYQGFDLSAEPHSKVYFEQNKKYTDTIRPSSRMETFTFSIDQVLAFRAKMMKAAAANPSSRQSQIPVATPGVFWWLAGATGP